MNIKSIFLQFIFGFLITFVFWHLVAFIFVLYDLISYGTLLIIAIGSGIWMGFINYLIWRKNGIRF